MKKLTVAIALAFMLTGCAPMMVKSIEDRFKETFLHKPIDEAIAKLGEPISNNTVRGRHIYAWSKRTAIPPRNSIEYLKYRFCRVAMDVDEQLVVTAVSVSGELYLCSQYEKLLPPETSR